MTLGYRLSPNEEHQLLKDENERRRKLRLIQVINNRPTLWIAYRRRPGEK